MPRFFTGQLDTSEDALFAIRAYASGHCEMTQHQIDRAEALLSGRIDEDVRGWRCPCNECRERRTTPFVPKKTLIQEAIKKPRPYGHPQGYNQMFNGLYYSGGYDDDGMCDE